MADGSRGVGRGGRGAALLKALQSLPSRPGASAAEETKTPVDPQTSGQGVAPPPAIGRGLGRGALYAALIGARQTSDASSVTETPGASIPQTLVADIPQMAVSGAPVPAKVPTQYMGRGISRVPLPATAPGSAATPQSTVVASSPPSSVRGGSPGSLSSSMASMRMADAVVMRGTDGKSVRMTANYIRLKVAPGKGVFEYHVLFNPQVDSQSFRFQLVRRQEAVLGNVQIFDGAKLYLPHRLREPTTVLTGEHPVDASPVSLHVKFVAEHTHQEGSANIHLYNVLFKRVMNALNMTRVGRNYFDSRGGIPVPKHKLEVWPGYVTHVDNYEDGVMLVTDVSHRVLRTITVRDILGDLMTLHANQFKEMAVKVIVGSTVLTRYNNKTYRVDEISWDENPRSTFEDSHGNPKCYIDYYKSHYDLDIKDDLQPLLIHRAKPHKGQQDQKTRLIALIPELSVVTGLTDEMRADFRVMKDIAAHTRLTPAQRKLSYNQFLQNVDSCPAAKQHLANWGLTLDTATINLAGRVVPSETIYYGNGRHGPAGEECDWGRDLGRNPVMFAVALERWCIICIQRNMQNANDFIQMMQRVCPAMGIQVASPKIIIARDDRNESFLSAIRSQINDGRGQLQIVVILCPTSRDDRYTAIKKLCCCEMPVPSQVINVKTIAGQPNKLRSVTQKVALQMNAKLGGELWSVSIPLKSLMIVGIDVYHDAVKRGRSVVGFVSSLNVSMTRWFSRSVYQEPKQEIVDGLKVCLIEALKKFHQVNHTFPERIVVFRDGVGDGQLSVVAGHEVQQLLSTFSVFGPDYKPKLSVIVVQKRITTRLFITTGPQQQLQNPPPGTVMDHTIMRRSYFDFLLVSQHVRQGTVTPTHYIVVYDGNNFKPDHAQRLSYKMTHLYYNWPGTVRVPAPCQYAHKLAQLVGQNLHKAAAPALEDRLFYL